MLIHYLKFVWKYVKSPQQCKDCSGANHTTDIGSHLATYMHII